MKRYLHDQILKDLKKKMVIVTGPRQVGKTYLAKDVMKAFPSPQYLNHDNENDRRIIRQRSWRLDASFLAFDEINQRHKITIARSKDDCINAIKNP